MSVVAATSTSSNSSVLNNSIDADLFRSMSSGRDFRGELGLGESTLLVSSIGRLVPEKGVTCISRPACALRDADVRFVLAGDGPLRAEVEGCGCPNVTYVGRLSEGDVSALLRSSDAFCLPSRSEGFSTSLLECAACAAVPIVTHVGGVDELIPDESRRALSSAAWIQRWWQAPSASSRRTGRGFAVWPRSCSAG